MLMKKIIIINNNKIVTKNAELADSFFTRFRGLMFRKSIADNYALVITPCNQIHMLNMKFAIDVVYLDNANTVVKIERNIQPGKICKTVKQARSVIEVKAFAAAQLGIHEGDTLKITLGDEK